MKATNRRNLFILVFALLVVMLGFGMVIPVFPFLAETPAVILDALKLYAAGKGSDPYARQREATRQREETLQTIRIRHGRWQCRDGGVEVTTR